jgi:REP element-mobilizing transposase RayT
MYPTNPYLQKNRNSQMSIGEIYFWTCTIKDWKNLLKPDKYKQIVIDCLKELKEKNLITIYAYVIMPNHIHIVWEMNKKMVVKCLMQHLTKKLLMKF